MPWSPDWVTEAFASVAVPPKTPWVITAPSPVPEPRLSMPSLSDPLWTTNAELPVAVPPWDGKPWTAPCWT